MEAVGVEGDTCALVRKSRPTGALRPSPTLEPVPDTPGDLDGNVAMLTDLHVII